MYDANRLAEVVEKKKSLHNWLTYYKNKFERTSKRPITKVFYKIKFILVYFVILFLSFFDALLKFTCLISI